MTLKELKKDLLEKNNIVLVGSTNSGKSWFIAEELIPSLEKEGYKVSYIKECGDIHGNFKKADFVVVDEVETFFDREYLEKRHPEETPYYTDDYVEKVQGWHKNLENISVPSVFIITRNNEEEIDNLVDNMIYTDWGTKVRVVKFDRNNT